MPQAVHLELDVASLRDTLGTLGGMEERINDLRPAWKVVASLLEQHVSSNFESEGGRIGQPWKPLAASTVRARQRGWGYYSRAATGGAGPSHPILVWTGKLKKSFRRSGQGHRRLVSKSRLTWGSTVHYGKFLQGKRPMLEFRDQFQLREITFQPVRMHVLGAARGAISMAMGGRVRLGPLARLGS